MLYESERKVLSLIWDQEGIPAKELARLLEPSGWSRSTTYTIISHCIEKGYIRREGKYQCYSQISREEAQKQSIRETLNDFFDNSVTRFFVAFTESRQLSNQEREELKDMIEQLK